jgi:hypothetical protein
VAWRHSCDVRTGAPQCVVGKSSRVCKSFKYQLACSENFVPKLASLVFDLPKINSRFLTHKLGPPKPYKTVDTLKIARSFAFDSNKLDDLGRYLGIGRKLPHTGFHLWKGCMTKDEASWKLLKRYNAHDVALLEDLYYILRSWHKSHPNVNQGQTGACPKCSSTKVQRRGFSYTATRPKQRYQCTDCTGWFEGAATKAA